MSENTSTDTELITELADVLGQPLVVETVELDSIIEDPANARLHGPRNLDTIKSSLRLFGQVEPLLVQRSTRKIIGGHGRKRAMTELGWTQARVVFLDIDDTKATALAITLNRSSEQAEWDFKALRAQFETLQGQGMELEQFGWKDFEVQPIMAANWTPPALPSDNSGEHGDDASRAKPISVTPNMRKVIDPAIAQVRQTEGDPDISEGRCIELICASFMRGLTVDADTSEGENPS